MAPERVLVVHALVLGRNPIWRGGGVVFGPLGIENYTKRLSKASKRVCSTPGSNASQPS